MQVKEFTSGSLRKHDDAKPFTGLIKNLNLYHGVLHRELFHTLFSLHEAFEDAI